MFCKILVLTINIYKLLDIMRDSAVCILFCFSGIFNTNIERVLNREGKKKSQLPVLRRAGWVDQHTVCEKFSCSPLIDPQSSPSMVRHNIEKKDCSFALSQEIASLPGKQA